MRFSTLLVAGISAIAHATHDAPVVLNNPHVTYQAVFPKDAFYHGNIHGNVCGSVRASRGPHGRGVRFDVRLENLPKEGGPFLYHIHEDRVPADGNCTKTLAHLDPYGRGEDPPCDSRAKDSCQVGDLSGKYGQPKRGLEIWYFDNYTSLAEGTPAFLGNRSIVVHFANKTRITCANFEKLSGCPA
ncbi:Cell surface Cu-only superoxide dismutase [Metarhizium brunneum]|uniref:superoxide dismutase n=1 Tax=Metarhizium brunneum TaxID=500148 RepID=A0A7D5Z9A1_9HYPO